MLHWPAGPRDSDGVWAPYWYDAVARSTGFEAWHPREIDLSPHDAARRRDVPTGVRRAARAAAAAALTGVCLVS